MDVETFIEKAMVTPLKNIKCPKCKKIVGIKCFMAADSKVESVKYKFKCGKCGHEFVSPWRKYASRVMEPEIENYGVS